MAKENKTKTSQASDNTSVQKKNAKTSKKADKKTNKTNQKSVTKSKQKSNTKNASQVNKKVNKKSADSKDVKNENVTKQTKQTKKHGKYSKIMPPQKIEPIKISFLGGINEVGKNMTCYEYSKSMIIVDCGLAFSCYNIDNRLIMLLHTHYICFFTNSSVI